MVVCPRRHVYVGDLFNHTIIMWYKHSGSLPGLQQLLNYNLVANDPGPYTGSVLGPAVCQQNWKGQPFARPVPNIFTRAGPWPRSVPGYPTFANINAGGRNHSRPWRGKLEVWALLVAFELP